MRQIINILVFSIFGIFIASIPAISQVRVTESPLVIPTYLVGAPETIPLFYTPEVYQGAQLRIYPYPYIGNLNDTRVDKQYNAVIIENEYIKVCILPELGGRIYYAIDKTDGYDFVYHNKVIKPALIGMTGAWISGGIEWNVPHHHRASTFMPVDYKIDNNSDGSKTVWVGEYEKRAQTRWCVGLTLYPGKSYLEASLRYINVTPVINSFLFWANTAVHANENYQVIFPPDVERATFHSKVSFTDYPVSHQVYQGIDFTKGVDVSWWKNTPSPTSFFAWDTQKDFIAGIDHGKKAGTAIIGNHYIFAGKKFWNWGNNDVQRMWDQMLTDSDGPYLEMMMGLYSDNQPDYSWNAPYGLKSGTMYFYPLKNLNSVQEANKNMALDFELKNGKITLQINTTSKMADCRLVIYNKGNEILTRQVNLDPVLPFYEDLKAPANVKPEDLMVQVFSAENIEMIRYTPPIKKNKPEPEKYVAPGDPSSIISADKLYETGLRLEQFGNGNLDPLAYYKEALKRDSNHIFTNTQLGIHYLKTGRFEEAQHYLERAVKMVTANYTSAKYGEPLYYLGVDLFDQEKYDESYELLSKAAWNSAWESSSDYLLAVMDCIHNDFNAAIDKLSNSLAANSNNLEAIQLMAIILRRNSEEDLADQTLKEVDNIDPLSLVAAYERYQMDKAKDGLNAAKKLRTFFRDEVDNYLETASRYIEAGFYKDASDLLELAISPDLPATASNPLIYYYLGYCSSKAYNQGDAAAWFKKAATQKMDYCFPYGITSQKVLQEALKTDSADASAHYLLGNLLCDNDPEAAFSEWQKSVSIQNTAMTNRNLAFLLANYFDKPLEALTFQSKAIALDPNHPLLLQEYDTYSEYAGVAPSKRLEFLETNMDAAMSWDKTALRRAELLTWMGRNDEAIQILEKQHFYIAEITSLNPHTVWTDAHLLRAMDYMDKQVYDKAITDLNAIFQFPRNLEIARDSKIVLANYWLGKVYQKKGDLKKANEYFTLMAENQDIAEGWGATGNALSPFFQALAYQELNKPDQAREIFNRLLKRGDELLNKKYPEAAVEKSVSIRQSMKNDKTEGNLYIALANLGQGNKSDAGKYLNKAEEINASLLDIQLARKMLKR